MHIVPDPSEKRVWSDLALDIEVPIRPVSSLVSFPFHFQVLVLADASRQRHLLLVFEHIYNAHAVARDASLFVVARTSTLFALYFEERA